MCGNDRIRIRSFCLFAFWCCFRPGAPAESFSFIDAEGTDWSGSSMNGTVSAPGNGFTFSCDFSGTEDRLYWDLELKHDFSAFDGIWVRYRYEDPAAFRAVTLHFESGAGWYAISLPVSEHPRSLFLPFESFEVQGEPEGWDTISRFRVSPWKGSSASGRFILMEARARRSRFLLVEPNESDFQSAEERRYARGISDALASHFSAMGLPIARLPDAGAAGVDLDRFQVILFPVNPKVSTELSDALRSYVSGGGKLALFYSASSELAKLAGFESQRYMSSSRKNQWSVFSFDDRDWAGPGKVEQVNTDNLLVVPVSGDSRVLAWWEDGQGRRQREPAVVLSEHALWFSSVLTPDNEEAKRRMLAFALDRLRPETGIILSAVSAASDQARERARMPWDRFLLESDEHGDLKKLEKQLQQRLAEGDAVRAWEAVDRLSREIDLRVAAGSDLPPSVLRGIWDHTGDGVARGEWEDTFSLLSSANLTDYFMFVPRQSPPPSRVTTAAGAFGVGVHAWHICFNLYGVSPLQVRRYEREGRLQINQAGEVLPWLCPANERNRRVELRRLSQLAEAPGLRGIHLDYLRWPDGVHCTCSSCEEAFTRYLKEPLDWPLDAMEGRHHTRYLEWRTGVIRLFMETTSRQLRGRHPDLRLSAAVWPGYPGVIDRLGQDWVEWMKNDWLDFIVPMNYTSSSAQFKEWMEKQSASVPDPGDIMAGIGYRSSESRLYPAQVLEQIRIAAAAGASGYVLFELNPSFQSELVSVLQVSYERGE